MLDPRSYAEPAPEFSRIQADPDNPKSLVVHWVRMSTPRSRYLIKQHKNRKGELDGAAYLDACLKEECIGWDADTCTAEWLGTIAPHLYPAGKVAQMEAALSGEGVIGFDFTREFFDFLYAKAPIFAGLLSALSNDAKLIDDAEEAYRKNYSAS